VGMNIVLQIFYANLGDMHWMHIFLIIIIIHSFLYRHKVVTSENYYFNTTRHFCLDLSVSTRDLSEEAYSVLFSFSSSSCHGVAIN